MPTQRPAFFSSFLTIFRAHSLPKAQPSISTSAAAASAPTIWTSAVPSQKQQASQASEPLPINAAKSTAYSTAAAAAGQLHASLTPLQHNVSPSTHLPRSPSSQGLPLPVYGPPNKPQPSYPTASESRRRRTRRGSDSSASSGGGGGFREPSSTGEAWFVGGRTATGEEKFYKLSMVKRDRSSDRISADQLSL